MKRVKKINLKQISYRKMKGFKIQIKMMKQKKKMKYLNKFKKSKKKSIKQEILTIIQITLLF